MLAYRRMEVREKLERMEKDVKEALDPAHFTNKDEDYIVNRLIGIQEFIIDETPLNFQFVSIRELRRRQREALEGEGDDDDPNKGRRKPKIDLPKYRLGYNRAKGETDEERAERERLRAKKGDETTIEDLRWKIHTRVKDAEELKKHINEL